MRRSPDLICFSHLDWDAVYQRPQHLMTRFARDRRVFYVDEVEGIDGDPRLDIRALGENLRIVTPRLPEVWGDARYQLLRGLIDQLVRDEAIRDYVAWYYTPMALPCTRHLLPGARATVYDCMDELASFKDAPAQLRTLEAELFARADVVFTGGQSLYEAKRLQHGNVYAFPSSVDVAHFAQARDGHVDPADQASIPHPRLGFCGVIDERMDLDLVDAVARQHPDWQIALVGPVAKINAGALPRRDNIHRLGKKAYDELPAYLAGWDIGWLPFARNEATRFISPTKTPEYLAAGLPVVSTSIRDVVRPYGDLGLVRIADCPDSTAAAIEQALCPDGERQARADAFLRTMSWDATFRRMDALIEAAMRRRPVHLVESGAARTRQVESPVPLGVRPVRSGDLMPATVGGGE